MNSWSAMGRLTHDPELTQTPNGVSVCKFRIAVNRKYRNKDGEYEADFINCVAWRSTAEFVSKYFSKGSMIGVVGSIQTRTYDDSDGKKRYITEAVIEDVTFAESKKSSYSGQSASTESAAQQNSDPKQEKAIPLDDGSMQIDTYDSLTYSCAGNWHYLNEG